MMAGGLKKRTNKLPGLSFYTMSAIAASSRSSRSVPSARPARPARPARSARAARPIAPSAPALTYSLVYRGNAIDGWIATFIAYTALKVTSSVKFYPISAGREVTVKQLSSWSGSHVLLLDLSLSAESLARVSAVALSVETLDHRSEEEASLCTSRLVWRKWYAEQVEPFWLGAVDRISRWDNPTLEDRCLREVLTQVSHIPPADAVRATEKLMTWMMTPLCPEFQSLMAQGHAKLSQKDSRLLTILEELGRTHVIQEADVNAWGLTAEWVGLTVFLLDNSDIIIDTNEAAAILFANKPEVTAFINYRKKVRRDHKTFKLGLAYLYSARSHGFDLTTGDFFQGQKRSAGAQRFILADGVMPFVVPDVPAVDDPMIVPDVVDPAVITI